MPMPIFVNKALKLLKKNSPEILTALGVSGVITTSYLASKATVTAVDIIRANEVNGPHPDAKERFKERTKHTWRLYIPTAISGAVTIGCIIGASKANGRRTAAAVTAYSLTERAFSEYREKVVEEIGKGKEQKIRDEIVQDRITNTPPGNREIIITGKGDVMCCELYTHRYFRSDMQSLLKAQNDINSQINHELYVALDEFYDLIGLAHTSESDKVGWNSDRLMELKFSTVMSENGEPCLAFEYNYIKLLW
jgi:hypothetical protein